MFPSPLGVSYFQIGKADIERLSEYFCFRPLSGYLISKSFILIYVTIQKC